MQERRQKGRTYENKTNSKIAHMKLNISIIILLHAAAAAKSHQSCLTLCNPIDGSPPGSSVPGILQARILEWDRLNTLTQRQTFSDWIKRQDPDTCCHQEMFFKYK